MTYLVCGAVLGFLIATIVAPAVDGVMRRRRELARCGGRVHVHVTTPRFDGGPRRRGDQSPVPRRPALDRDDYHMRRVADGMEQT